MFHIDTTYLEQGKILQIDFTAHFGHVTCIHCNARNIFLFDNPYMLQLQVSFSERDIMLQIIYFDKLEESQFNLICLK